LGVFVGHVSWGDQYYHPAIKEQGEEDGGSVVLQGSCKIALEWLLVVKGGRV
jgi:hypothetical protein